MKSPPAVPIDDLARRIHAPVRHEWDSWDPCAAVGHGDLRTQALLRFVSDRAKLAFAIGCAEWVIERLQPWLENDQTPWKFIEACWVFEMSPGHALPPESEESAWQGPILGPVDLALMTILNTAIGFEDDNAEVDSAFAAQLAIHVIASRQAFLHWRRVVLHRLRRNFPIDSDDRCGSPVPREALMIGLPFDPCSNGAYVHEFLADVDASSNVFIIGPGDRPLTG